MPKNYHVQGGDEFVIGGTLTIGAAATIAGLASTTSKAGIAKQSTKVAAAAGASPTKEEFDALIAALVTAGLMKAT